jgi:uncharacterized lipoprotein YddW (UPF0748 family)
MFLLSCVMSKQAEAQEMRGAWIARDYLASRVLIAKAMDSLAANNFNTAFVNVWSRGYPLYQSALFNAHTGISTDPNFTGRDVLQEAVAEAHRVGLHIEAWFEYGFVGGYSGYLPGTSGKGKIFDVHPDWVAKQQDGTEIDGSSFYWMIHTNPEAQNFLIGMATEIARNYDVDGIELDRTRYSSLSYGYDAYTDSLYRAEHANSAPPATTSDVMWKQWRADKLNQFIARAYDSIKAINPNLNVSNAPSLYSSSSYSSFDSFCQDWVWWVNNNKVDNVHVQMYVSSPATFGSYIDNMLARVNNLSKLFPSFAVKPNSTPINTGVATQMIDVTRIKGLSGNAIWYFSDLIGGFFSEIKANRYTAKTFPPYSTQDWRSHSVTLPISNVSSAVRIGTWLSSANQGFSGNSLYASDAGTNSIEYTVTIPATGNYEVYAFTIISSNRTAAAPYTIHTSGGTIQVFVDQTVSANSGWKKLGDFHFTSGAKKIVTLSNDGIGSGKLVSADALLISLNRRLSPDAQPGALSVEFENFSGFYKELLVHLNWNTATEENNYGFEVERKKMRVSGFDIREQNTLPITLSSKQDWIKLGFVEGSGTSTTPHSYSFVDEVTRAGTYIYRLRQIDHNGAFRYSSEMNVTISGYPNSFSLEQNYPNPFNPITTIQFSVPDKANNEIVTLTVYDMLGREVTTVANGKKEPGVYTVQWNASGLSSGMYFYTLRGGEFINTKKLTLLK